MSRNDYHVLPNSRLGGWDVRREHGLKASRHFETQDKAIAAARKMSRRAGTELFIHGMDGEILRKDSHGHDPFPPRG
ncbi:DUF2188 domain-containing protein [Legionella jordanis]|uniref:DUF2188 domain-containing protein n=1 Tax=Legionella jordanis TaxID=456 RepID=A0A0W0VBK4_9GAMM|nr:DUF2188 domain-containing protein [Legionella jordanis]KTD17516.1 hypothetical protein Ljor_1822 [Legionella jordanis]RMX05146.1 DUF2188 domain-containing protein [Legionella jordanis]RMX17402.1 DUF2188 domain-containing protein [Legionella jordanis]VEH13485.1 Uncharacterised protein [Legionella jordanis]HAT8714402.1 DUF2188 domain-containing protein [Legionella jordanis]